MSCQVVESQVKTLKIVVVKAQFHSNTEPVDITNLIIFVYYSETKKDTLLLFYTSKVETKGHKLWKFQPIPSRTF